MKAIVLSCDRYRLLADHMILAYGRLWPRHPFRFRVPYQELAPTQPQARVEYRKTPLAIKPTMRELLADLPDDEWIYWAIDDKYPIWMELEPIERLLAWIATPAAEAADCVLFCRCMWMWDPKRLTGERLAGPGGELLLERRAWEQIWMHQFVRVKVIRYLFDHFPDEIPNTAIMDEVKRVMPKPPSLRLWVTRRNRAAFGESTEQGTLTPNCRRSIVAHGLVPSPEFAATTPRNHVQGTHWDNFRWRARIWRASLRVFGGAR
jgi:hypothetical protein